MKRARGWLTQMSAALRAAYEADRMPHGPADPRSSGPAGGWRIGSRNCVRPRLVPVHRLSVICTRIRITRFSPIESRADPHRAGARARRRSWR